MSQRITYTNQVGATLDHVLASTDYSSLHIIADENTATLVLPRISCDAAHKVPPIVIPAGDHNKNLDTLSQVWSALAEQNATRHSLVLCVGGGMVTDLGGMAAATYKRGIAHINVPTTLLGAVDAAVGGKTGINFNGLKNEVGTFTPATDVIISTCYLDTLPLEQLLSGYAEMIKHAMLDNHHTFNALTANKPSFNQPEVLLKQVETSVNVKNRIVALDPHELGLRRALNLGHTVGHAIEEIALKRAKPIPHGYAVAWGLVTESVLSHILLKFPSNDLHRLATFVRDLYGAPDITCDDYPTLLDLMRHDKKSHHGEISCALLRQCGDAVVDNTITDEDMKVALDITRDYMGK